MHFALAFTAAFGLGAVVSAHPAALLPRQETGLHTAIVAAGKEYFGTALTIRDDQAETDIITSPADFGSITPENAMKWEEVQPSEGEFTFDDADAVADFAAANSKHLRCHTLVWYSQLPSWVSDGGFDNKTLIEVMRTHIDTIVGRYKGVCDHWDVVNEALDEDGSYRDNVFLQVIGEAYLPMAFQMAAEADPDAKLYYNDFNLAFGEAKAEGARRIVELVQSYGVKIDGVGLQGHLTTESTDTQPNPTPDVESLADALRMFTDLGVEVAYTEVDIRMNMPSSPEKLEDQAAAYDRVTRACMSVEKCVGITIWGVSDQYSWVPETFDGEGAALLWDENFEKKPAYQTTLDAITTSGTFNGTTGRSGTP